LRGLILSGLLPSGSVLNSTSATGSVTTLIIYCKFLVYSSPWYDFSGRPGLNNLQPLHKVDSHTRETTCSLFFSQAYSVSYSDGSIFGVPSISCRHSVLPAAPFRIQIPHLLQSHINLTLFTFFVNSGSLVASLPLKNSSAAGLTPLVV